MSKRPNILLFMVDELRYPTSYDGPELRAWMAENLVAQRALRENGVDLQRHYIQSAACVPSRASIFTGQYPSLHGASQTDGIGKHAWDPGMFWLDPNTVPTLGDWFRAAGYQTYYKGKWHVSWADILIPGTHESLPSNTDEGVPILENVAYYKAADRLDQYGFNGWIGPEPHGADKANSGWLRDPLYKHETLQLLRELAARPEDDQPWLIVNSYVNPHDIVFSGLVWKLFGFPVPPADFIRIPPPPTQNEDLGTKPRAQQSYVDTYPKMFLPQPTDEEYRQFYYFLQPDVEQYIYEVYSHVLNSRFRDDTIFVFTSDHGEMLGAHGGMHQKWYQAYEETIHVPLIFSGKPVTQSARALDDLTSHADLIPTLLGLAGVDVQEAALVLARDHTEVRPLVGRDLSRAIRGEEPIAPEPVYFTTTDDISQGLRQITGRTPWAAVIPPNQLESVVVSLEGKLWKYTRYYEQSTAYPDIDNPMIAHFMELGHSVREEYEMYDLTGDPTEVTNLVYPGNETAQSIALRPQLQAILEEQRQRKCLTPRVNEGTRRHDGEGAVRDGREEAEASPSRPRGPRKPIDKVQPRT